MLLSVAICAPTGLHQCGSNLLCVHVEPKHIHVWTEGVQLLCSALHHHALPCLDLISSHRASPHLTSPYLTSPFASVGIADKAWVPTGTHFLDKQAHEALAPKRPPNSPQGNNCPSPATRHQRSPAEGRAAATSAARPAWDDSPSKAPRAVGSSPGASPTWAQLKKMTSSWSPGRKGFVKPELAQNKDNRFPQTHKHADMRSKRNSKMRKKASQKPYSSGVPANTTQDAAKLAKHSSGGSIWEGKLAGPSSFLQPILHSQSSNAQPESQDDHKQTPTPTKKKNRPSSRKVKQHAHMHRHQSKDDDDDVSYTGSHAHNSPPKVFSLGQSPRGSYVSPLRDSSRRALSVRHDSALLALQASPHRASSAPAPSPHSATESSRLSCQPSAGYSARAHSSELSTRDSGVADCTSSEAKSEPGSDLSDDLGSEGSKVQSWDSKSLHTESVAKKGKST